MKNANDKRKMTENARKLSNNTDQWFVAGRAAEGDADAEVAFQFD